MKKAKREPHKFVFVSECEKMTNHESRAYNAKRKMQDAMIDLLRQKEFLAITVKELCLLAGVNRSTFYAHYENTYELLEDTKNYMINAFFESVASKGLPARENTDDFISEPFLVPYLQFIRENHRMYETYRDIFGDRHFADLIRKISAPTGEKYRTPHRESTLIYATRFFIGGIDGMVREWIKREFAETEEELARLIVRLKR